jgi:hypothetical protein
MGPSARSVRARSFPACRNESRTLVGLRLDGPLSACERTRSGKSARTLHTKPHEAAFLASLSRRRNGSRERLRAGRRGTR